MLNRARNGFTLVELVVVFAIIAILSATLWMVLGPRAKVSAFETRVTSDLRQVVMAIHIYMADNSDEWPNSMRDLPAGTPRRVQGWASWKGSTRYEGAGEGDGAYVFLYDLLSRQTDLGHNPKYPWDPNVVPIVGSPLHRLGANVMTLQWYDCFKPPVKMLERDTVTLSAFEDGHVKWVSENLPWLNENTCCKSQGVGWGKR